MPENETPTNPAAPETEEGLAPAGNTGSPEDGLNVLKDQLQQRQSELEVQTKKRDALKEDIGALESAVNKVKQVLDQYTQALATFTQDYNAIQEYLNNKQRMIDAALDNKKKKDIDTKITNYDSDITKKQDDYTKKESAKADALTLFDSAKKELEKQQANFDLFMQSKTDLEKRFQEMKQLKGLIEQEEDKNQLANMYFLAKELKDILDKTSVPSKEAMQGNLYQAWNQLHNAKKEASEKKVNWELKKSEFEIVEKALGELKQKRREEILKKIVN
jgi:chromosome segregation ATPase